VKKENEFKNFQQTMQRLMRVPDSEIKAKLDAEKKEKAEIKQKKLKRSTND